MSGHPNQPTIAALLWTFKNYPACQATLRLIIDRLFEEMFADEIRQALAIGKEGDARDGEAP